MKYTLFLSSLVICLFTLFTACTKDNSSSNQDQSVSNKTQAPPILIETIDKVEDLRGVRYEKKSNNLNNNILTIFTNSSIFLDVDLPPKTKHTLEITGKGDLINGEGSKVAVVIDGLQVRVLEFKSPDFKQENIHFETKGLKTKITLSFINDYFNRDTKADRNFFLKALKVK